MKKPLFLISLAFTFMLMILSCEKDDTNSTSDNTNVDENTNLETGTFTDARDGKTYKTVKIGEQVWMAENLAYEPSSGNYWAYDNNNSNVETYGRLYDWETACDVCPTGWHLPSDAEWKELTNYLGRETSVGGKMKEIGTSHWFSPNEGATNESGFSALPGGYRHYDGDFLDMGYFATFWSSTERISHYTWTRSLAYGSTDVYRSYDYKAHGYSVRCVRDN